MERRAIATLCAIPALIALFAIFGPLTTDPVILFGGVGTGFRRSLLPGYGTIDPNMGYTAYALGVRAAQDLASGSIPLWNPYEGLGAPLLGEVQAAAMFPPTLLLLLPNGQVLEQTLLQALAGVGTFLFLRRFGLGVTAALAGGLLFELNGVFAWLRNAIFNPVAFLPWLFLTTESLYCAHLADRTIVARAPAIGLGALTAALALYAGFPEVVYFYSLLLLGWAACRLFALPWRHGIALLGDLIAVALLALLLSAPLLVAFGSFIGQAELGGHKGDLFAGAVLPPSALLPYLLPYVYGPIFAASDPDVSRIWGEIGGYLGVLPLALGMAGLACCRRQPICWLLAAWVVIAVGASHGVPGLHTLFTKLPLATIAAYDRYLNAGWIFCCVVLSALFIDRLPSLPAATRRRIGALACLLCLGLAVGAAIAAGPVLADLWHARAGQRRYIVISAAAAAILLLGAALALRLPARRAQLTLTGLLALEALTAFLLPFASLPPKARIDRALIGFLQHNAGLQRIVQVTVDGLRPNFGSVFRIPQFNYDDLPVPQRTVTFIHDRLDATASSVEFRPNVSSGSAAERSARRLAVLRQLPVYRSAGVRYILADNDFFAEPAFDFEGGPAHPMPLTAGQSGTFTAAGSAEITDLQGISISIGTYGGSADGILRARLCQATRCAEGSAALASARDNGHLPIAFATPISLLPDQPWTVRITKDGGHNQVALWLRGAAGAELPDLYLSRTGQPQPILQTQTAAVFELANPRPYASAQGCRVEPASHTHFTADCDQASRLTRLEVFMRGWTARVNGEPAAITPVDDTFQGIDLPSGASVIDFDYTPPGWRVAAPLALVALVATFGLIALVGRRNRRPYTSSARE